MKYRENAKRRFITAEICFLIVIAIILFKFLPETDYLKMAACVCIGSLVCGTIVNLVLYFVEVKIIHRDDVKQRSKGR